MSVGLASALVLFVIRSVRRLNFWIWKALAWLMLVWFFTSMLWSVEYRNTNLALLTLALGLLTVFYVNFLKTCLERSFMDPRVKWYHGAPQSIPALRARALPIGLEASVARFDKSGAFVFFSRKDSPAEVPERFLFEFEHRDHRIRLEAVPMVLLELPQILGFGVRFENLNGDVMKALGDFFERLQGGGYSNESVS